jgi:hypothetical protein
MLQFSQQLGVSPPQATTFIIYRQSISKFFGESSSISLLLSWVSIICFAVPRKVLAIKFTTARTLSNKLIYATFFPTP